MKEALLALRLIGYFLPIVQAVVELIEQWTKGKISGTEKKSRALDLLGAIWNGLANNPDVKIKEIKGLSFDWFRPWLEMLVDGLVAVANSVGLFTHSDK